MTDHFSATVAATSNCDLNLKVILIGESGAGKSSILERFTRNTFSDVTQSTIAVDFQIKYAQIKSKRVAVQVWDTAGQEKYFTITTGYYRQADAVLLVCDLTSTESYNRLDKWYSEVRMYCRPGTPCALLGNKCDLDGGDRKVSIDAVRAWASHNQMPFFETSARAGSNIDTAFSHVCEQAVDVKLASESAYRSNQVASNQVPRTPADKGARDEEGSSDVPRSATPSVKLTQPPQQGAPVKSESGKCAC